MYELYDPCTVMFFYRFVARGIILRLELNPLQLQQQAHHDRSGDW